MHKHLKTILIITGAVCALLITLSIVFALVYLPIMRENNKTALEKQKQEQTEKLDTCLKQAEIDYNGFWQTKCRDMLLPSKGDFYDLALKAQLDSEARLKQTDPSLKNTDPDDYQIIKCDLPSKEVDTIDKQYKSDKDGCYKRYPQ